MKYIVMTILLCVTTAYAQSIPSPEFGSDINIALLLKDYAAQSNLNASPLDARVNMAATGRVVTTWNIPLPIPNWNGLFSQTNQDAAAIRMDARREVTDLKSVRTNVAASIDNVNTNIGELQATTNLSATFTSAENRALVNALRRELIDQSQELKTALQQLREIRRYIQSKEN